MGQGTPNSSSGECGDGRTLKIIENDPCCIVFGVAEINGDTSDDV